MSKFVPFTPGKSMLMHLTAKTEELAWKNLLRDVSHMPYKTILDFKKRGYTVKEMK